MVFSSPEWAPRTVHPRTVPNRTEHFRAESPPRSEFSSASRTESGSQCSRPTMYASNSIRAEPNWLLECSIRYGSARGCKVKNDVILCLWNLRNANIMCPWTLEREIQLYKPPTAMKALHRQRQFLNSTALLVAHEMVPTFLLDRSRPLHSSVWLYLLQLF